MSSILNSVFTSTLEIAEFMKPSAHGWYMSLLPIP